MTEAKFNVVLQIGKRFYIIFKICLQQL